MSKPYSLFFLIFLLASAFAGAQSLPTGTPVLEDYYRRMQLTGQVDSNISFTVRPLYPLNWANQKNNFSPDTSIEDRGWHPATPITFAGGYGVFKLLPLVIQQQYNSNHPYGWNDGAMIPARGYQTLISGGFYLKIGPLSIQVRPEYVYANNPAFVEFADPSRPDADLLGYYSYYDNTDMPERFGATAYKKMFLGQSSIRLTFDPVSIGVSNENIWWGPGINNALILSNNAPGFRHITLNTTRPIKSFLGYFEGEAVAGRLENTNYPATSLITLPSGYGLTYFKRNVWRYFTGININYHPKWIPGLTLGLTRTFNAYGPDVKTISEYVPFFFPYQKVNTNDGDPILRDQYTSLYARWLFKRAQAELYFEYGINDNSNNYRDFISNPEHSRAYVFGFRKMFKLKEREKEYILFSAEITQLSQTPDRLVRSSGAWYTHYAVREGYTQMGQGLGAGTGPGGNLQHADISWVKGLKKLGLIFDRYEHNADLKQSNFPDINNHSRSWVDLSIGAQGEWNYRNLLFSAKLQHILSLNYEWILKNYSDAGFYIPNNTVTNFHGELGVTFRF